MSFTFYWFTAMIILGFVLGALGGWAARTRRQKLLRLVATITVIMGLSLLILLPIALSICRLASSWPLDTAAFVLSFGFGVVIVNMMNTRPRRG